MKINMILKSVGLAFLMNLAATQQSFAGQGLLETINVGENPLIELPESPSNSAQVRINIQLRPYEKILATTPGSEGQKLDYRVIRPINHVLRARLDRTNHFYFGDWHIESIPTRWSREERVLDLNLRIYKRYGDAQGLEEYIGNVLVSGRLVGEDGVYNYQASAQQRFRNKHGHPIAEIFIGNPEVQELGTVARQPRPSRATN